jgi:hypothetical protein
LRDRKGEVEICVAYSAFEIRLGIQINYLVYGRQLKAGKEFQE